MTTIAVVTALRTEFAALSGQLGDATLLRCGMGPERVQAWLPRLAELAPDAVIIAGVAGGLDPSMRPGDIVVANEVRDEHGSIPIPAAAPLAAQLRHAGLPVHIGPILSCDHIVGGAHERRQLATTGAVAVDMESAAVARASSGVPTVVLRVVVDTPSRPVARLATVSAGARALKVLRRTAPALRGWAALVRPRKVLLAEPRSFCAGVERAIDIVERALERYPHPIYVRRQIVHNAHVVQDLQQRGAVFVHELDEVPFGATVVYSAHGVAPAVRAEAERRQLTVIDATCPLVAKVHSEARRFASRGNTVVLVGHAGHDETEGTLGEVPGRIHLVESPEDAALISAENPDRIAFLTQTTLAVHDAAATVDVLRRRFPLIQSSPTDDICYATTNRQLAVQAIAQKSDAVLVVGSVNSSNSLRLVEVAQRAGTRAYLIDDASEVLPDWLGGITTLGITAGASAPPYLVDEIIGMLRALGPVEVSEEAVAHEDVTFSLPKGVVG